MILWLKLCWHCLAWGAAGGVILVEPATGKVKFQEQKVPSYWIAGICTPWGLRMRLQKIIRWLKLSKEGMGAYFWEGRSHSQHSKSHHQEILVWLERKPRLRGFKKWSLDWNWPGKHKKAQRALIALCILFNLLRSVRSWNYDLSKGLDNSPFSEFCKSIFRILLQNSEKLYKIITKFRLSSRAMHWNFHSVNCEARCWKKKLVSKSRIPRKGSNFKIWKQIFVWYSLIA